MAAKLGLSEGALRVGQTPTLALLQHTRKAGRGGTATYLRALLRRPVPAAPTEAPPPTPPTHPPPTPSNTSRAHPATPSGTRVGGALSLPCSAMNHSLPPRGAPGHPPASVAPLPSLRCLWCCRVSWPCASNCGGRGGRRDASNDRHRSCLCAATPPHVAHRWPAHLIWLLAHIITSVEDVGGRLACIRKKATQCKICEHAEA